MYEYLGKRIPDPLEISTFCDAPVGSGLGSSSTLTVSMLQAYNDFYSLSLGENDLATIAYEIERKKLNLYGGQQDQYASAFGGINYIKFLKNESVEVNPLNLKWDIIAELEASLILAYTGISRDSASIIEDQITNAVKNENITADNLAEYSTNYALNFIAKDDGTLITENNLTSIKDIGRIMGFLKSNYAANINMGLASKVAKDLLEE